jgi:hypothetical protein
MIEKALQEILTGKSCREEDCIDCLEYHYGRFTRHLLMALYRLYMGPEKPYEKA